MTYSTWGNIKSPAYAKVFAPFWQDNCDLSDSMSYMPYGNGRCYGDQALNDQNILISTEHLRRFIHFDPIEGTIECESGLLLGDILQLIIKDGWFLPVVPGTQYVTVGGAIANDVHGKNHHLQGTFGCHVVSLKLLRSDGNVYDCSLSSNPKLFAATIAGMGMTGLILSAKLQLMPVSSTKMNVAHTSFSSIDEFIELSLSAIEHGEYSVAWLDLLNINQGNCRGVFIEGSHVCDELYLAGKSKMISPPVKRTLTVPAHCPNWVLNRSFMKAFNAFYYRQQSKKSRFTTNYSQFFFPLDSIMSWNKVYGRSGFYQYQLLIPGYDSQTVRSILDEISRLKLGSFLSVAKVFGEYSSPGLLSFPEKGVTLSLDIQKSAGNDKSLDAFDRVLEHHDCKIYAAKDARASSKVIRRSFQNWDAFMKHADVKFSSNLFRRYNEIFS